MMMLAFLAIVSLLTGGSSESVKAGPTCLSLALGDGGSPVINARVNDIGPFAFVLDTGSSGTTLDDQRIKQLGLVADGPTEQAQGMAGAVDVDLFRIRRFEAGPITLQNMVVPRIPAPSLRSHDIAGLAGVDIFGRVLTTWRWDRSCVELGKSGSKPTGSGWSAIRSRWLKPWKIMIPVRIGAARGWGLLDTGAQKTIISPAFARAAGLGEAAKVNDGAITGIDGNAASLAGYRVSATVGAWSFRNVDVGVAALPLFDRLGGMEKPLAVIGMDWIGSHQFAIDYGAERVWQRMPKRKTKG